MKNKGNTMAEVLLVLTVIGIVIAVVALGTRKNKPDGVIKFAYYNSYVAMQKVAAEILSSSNDKKVSADSQTFCEDAAEQFNTIGTINCGFTPTRAQKVNRNGELNRPNFVTSSGLSFYRGEDDAGGYTFWLDVNGERGRNEIDVEDYNETKADIFRFIVYRDNANGKVIFPHMDSKAAIDSNFISAKIINKPEGNAPTVDPELLAQNITYREAVCMAGIGSGGYCGYNELPDPMTDQNGDGTVNETDTDLALAAQMNQKRAFCGGDASCINIINTCADPESSCEAVINRPAPPLIKS